MLGDRLEKTRADGRDTLLAGNVPGGAVFHSGKRVAQQWAGNGDDYLRERAWAVNLVRAGGIVEGHFSRLQEYFPAVLLQAILAREQEHGEIGILADFVAFARAPVQADVVRADDREPQVLPGVDFHLVEERRVLVLVDGHMGVFLANDVV